MEEKGVSLFLKKKKWLDGTRVCCFFACLFPPRVARRQGLWACGCGFLLQAEERGWV